MAFLPQLLGDVWNCGIERLRHFFCIGSGLAFCPYFDQGWLALDMNGIATRFQRGPDHGKTVVTWPVTAVRKDASKGK